MAREYHSASSIELARRCRRAYAYRYIAGLKSPEPAWHDGLKGRARSLALGKALHATLERHFARARGEPDWLWLPGQVAASGLHLLPDPGNTSARVETSIGALVSSDLGAFEVHDADGESRGFGLEIAGVKWLGYRDLIDVENERVLDYKTTKSIKQWAKGPAELLQDLQANLYAYSAALEFEREDVECRWVYFETGSVRRAEPVDFVIAKPEALSVIEAAAEVARELDKYDTVEQAPMNVHACADYGGCEFHERAGGPCSARVSIGALIQARVKKDPEPMALSEETKARLAARAAGKTEPTPASAAPVEAAPEAEATPPAEPTPTAPVVVLPVTGTPLRTSPKARKSAVGASGTLAELAASLTAAEAARAEADAALESAKDAMRKALA